MQMSTRDPINELRSRAKVLTVDFCNFRAIVDDRSFSRKLRRIHAASAEYSLSRSKDVVEDGHE